MASPRPPARPSWSRAPGWPTPRSGSAWPAPFALPSRWQEARTRLDLATPLDFVSTADTIGGNSGSPVLNRAGELVGINFDRNRHGLVRNFVYTDEQARHIAVHAGGVLEALRKLYDAAPLAQEPTGP